MAYVIKRTPEFEDWLTEQTAKSQAMIEDRLDRVAQHEHFGQYGTGWKNLKAGCLS